MQQFVRSMLQVLPALTMLSITVGCAGPQAALNSWTSPLVYDEQLDDANDARSRNLATRRSDSRSQSAPTKSEYTLAKQRQADNVPGSLITGSPRESRHTNSVQTASRKPQDTTDTLDGLPKAMLGSMTGEVAYEESKLIARGPDPRNEQLDGLPKAMLNSMRGKTEAAPMSNAMQAEYQRALDEAGINDPVERTELLSMLETLPPNHRALTLRSLIARRKPAGNNSATRSGSNSQLVSHEEPAKLPAAAPTNQPQRIIDPQIVTASSVNSSITATNNSTKRQTSEELLSAAAQRMLEERPLLPDDQTRALEIIRWKLLQALQGNREAALSPQSELTPAQQAFVTQQAYGLLALLSREQSLHWNRRATSATEHFVTASEKLGQSSGLWVKNLQLCTEIKGFGQVTPFSKLNFRTGQDVLLYAELDRFHTENNERGYHTKFTSSLQLLDQGGRIAHQRELTPVEEYCGNRRRDYFVSYQIKLPVNLDAGEYTVKLIIHDELGNQTGETSQRITLDTEKLAAPR
jgi:hypothetical protein